MWFVWHARGKDVGPPGWATIWFCIQLVIGVLWSLAFFWLHNPAWGSA